MRTARPITAILMALVLAGAAAPMADGSQTTVAGATAQRPQHRVRTVADEAQEYVSLGQAVAHVAREQRLAALHRKAFAPSGTVRLPAVAADDAPRFDWGSAGIGAAVTLAGLAIAFTVALALRRRGVLRVHH